MLHHDVAYLALNDVRPLRHNSGVQLNCAFLVTFVHDDVQKFKLPHHRPIYILIGAWITHNLTKSFITIVCMARPKTDRTSAMSLSLKQSLRDTRTPQRLVRASLPMVSSNPRIATRGLSNTALHVLTMWLAFSQPTSSLTPPHIARIAVAHSLLARPINQRSGIRATSC